MALRPVVLAILVLAAVAGACRNGPKIAPRSDAAGRLDQPYPIESFATVDLHSRPVSLAAWKGQAVVVNVWATWCAPCRREMPALAALQAKYPDRLRVLGLLQDNVTDEFARQFLKTMAVTYPVARSSFEIERRLPAVLALPTTLVIDPAGRLVAMYAGEVDPAALEQEVLRALR